MASSGKRGNRLCAGPWTQECPSLHTVEVGDTSGGGWACVRQRVRSGVFVLLSCLSGLCHVLGPLRGDPLCVYG